MRKLPTDTAVSPLQVSFKFKPHKKRGKCCKQDESNIKPGNVPRISKLMALAIRFNGLVERGDVRDYADLARLGYVTRARITQIMNLLNLAPDIQETLLFLPRTIKGYDPIHERDLRPIGAVRFWQRQRKMWEELKEQKLGHNL